jgi:cholesterol oxidase
MSRLSLSIDAIQSDYDVVVIGSGYGGGIAASRISRAGRRVCVLERGKEFQPGEYPNTEMEALAEMQTHLPDGSHLGDRTSLYDLHCNQQLNVMVGCGLGGTSQLNANVSLEADPRVFDDPRWPAEVVKDIPTLVQQGYERAREMLKPTPYPMGEPHPDPKVGKWPELPKLNALQASFKALGNPIGKFYRPPINVTFEDKVNHAGVQQKACTLCGDCCSGCNYGAKNTVIMNYLPDAVNHGAEIFTRTEVRFVERVDGKWLVHYQLLDSGRETFDAPTLTVAADIVFISAGTLGSTEILLRSRANGLTISDELGRHLTGNGDVLAFGYNGDRVINGIGFGHQSPGAMEPVGPCITGIIDLRATPVMTDGMVIEEGSIPGALGPAMASALIDASLIGGEEEQPGFLERERQMLREQESLVAGPYHGAVYNTQTYLIMSHDSGNGRMYLADDALRVEWPGVGTEPIFAKANENLFEAGKALGGRFVRDPLWTRLFGDQLMTVHPLGGCVMGADATGGVVNHKGQVFSGVSGTAVYEGLYVNDGAVIPSSLGVNPLLTISAMAERSCAIAAADRGWAIDYTLPSVPRGVPAPLKAGMQFTETMSGFFSLQQTTDFARSAAQGLADGSTMSFTVAVMSDDLAAMLTEQTHPGAIVGTLSAPCVSPEPLTVTDGVFHLFIDDPNIVGQRLMTYDMPMVTNDGRHFFLHGFKETHSNTGLQIWGDNSTLYVTLYEGSDATGPVLGKGILHILPADFAKQMTTMKVTNATSEAQRLEGLVKFGDFFGKTIFDTYGGVLRPDSLFNPNAPPRKKRPLRAPIPELHPFAALDGVPLLLTRYQGGTKGPVILSHGLGVSSRIFSTDTIDTNLVEFLVAQGYDVWLLDYRDSIALPASQQESTGDQVATLDYPAAIDTVRRATGAESVQMLVHCYGSTTFFMAMLAGQQHVRSIVCSQIASDVIAVPLTRFKAGLHTPNVFKELGFESLTAYVASNSDWKAKLFDDALRLNPIQFKELCTNPVCHRITFLYSLLYEHAKLNTSTHDAMHELFGIANIASLEHLSLLVRTKHLVSAKGEEVYMQHLDRLKIPICFIHGELNDCYLPISTELTFNSLVETNGPGLYERHVIPGYGHIDCIFGQSAAQDVYPYMLAHLEMTATDK